MGRNIMAKFQSVYTALFEDTVTPLMLVIVALIFAVELSANLLNGYGIVALMHLIVIGTLEILIITMLLAGLVSRVRALFASIRMPFQNMDNE